MRKCILNCFPKDNAEFWFKEVVIYYHWQIILLGLMVMQLFLMHSKSASIWWLVYFAKYV